MNKSFVIFICTFDPFGKGRHVYTFENRCNADVSLVLGDEISKVFLDTKGKLQDVDEEMIEFLKYIENSIDEVAKASKSELVKLFNQKVSWLKEDKKVEVEYMTLLERDKEKIQEGIEQGKIEVVKALLDLLEDEVIADRTGIPLERVKMLREQEKINK